jgi:hypothetical protein
MARSAVAGLAACERGPACQANRSRRQAHSGSTTVVRRPFLGLRIVASDAVLAIASLPAR